MMRNAPVLTVDPIELPADELSRLDATVNEAKQSGNLDLSQLPGNVREQLLFALDAIANGNAVAAVASGKPLTTTEAAELLGMSRTYLTRLCNEGRIASYRVGSSLRIDAATVMSILRDRGQMRSEAREAVRTAEERRRRRAARAAGLV